MSYAVAANDSKARAQRPVPCSQEMPVPYPYRQPARGSRIHRPFLYVSKRYISQRSCRPLRRSVPCIRHQGQFPYIDEKVLESAMRAYMAADFVSPAYSAPQLTKSTRPCRYHCQSINHQLNWGFIMPFRRQRKTHPSYLCVYEGCVFYFYLIIPFIPQRGNDCLSGRAGKGLFSGPASCPYGQADKTARPGPPTAGTA